MTGSGKTAHFVLVIKT